MPREEENGILQLNLDLGSAFKKLWKPCTRATMELGILCKILRDKLETPHGPPADDIIEQLRQLSEEINSIIDSPNQDQRLKSTAKALRRQVSTAMPDLNNDPDLRAFDENQGLNARFQSNVIVLAVTSNDRGADTAAVASSPSNNVEILIKVMRIPTEVKRLDRGTQEYQYRYPCSSGFKINRVVQDLRREYKKDGRKFDFRYRTYAKYHTAEMESAHTRCRLRLRQLQGLDTVRAILQETGGNGPTSIEFVIRESEYVLGVLGEDPQREELGPVRLGKFIRQEDDFGIIFDLEDENEIQATLQRELPEDYRVSCVLAGPEYQPCDQPLRWSEDGLQAYLQAYDCSLIIVITPHSRTTVLQSMDIDTIFEGQVPAVSFTRTR